MTATHHHVDTLAGAREAARAYFAAEAAAASVDVIARDHADRPTVYRIHADRVAGRVFVQVRALRTADISDFASLGA